MLASRSITYFEANSHVPLQPVQCHALFKLAVTLKRMGMTACWLADSAAAICKQLNISISCNNSAHDTHPAVPAVT